MKKTRRTDKTLKKIKTFYAVVCIILNFSVGVFPLFELN